MTTTVINATILYLQRMIVSLSTLSPHFFHSLLVMQHRGSSSFISSRQGSQQVQRLLMERAFQSLWCNSQSAQFAGYSWPPPRTDQSVNLRVWKAISRKRKRSTRGAMGATTVKLLAKSNKLHLIQSRHNCTVRVARGHRI